MVFCVLFLFELTDECISLSSTDFPDLTYPLYYLDNILEVFNIYNYLYYSYLNFKMVD